MADIKLRIDGDASGGVGAMDDMGDSVGRSVVAWTEMVGAAKAAAKAVADFLIDSTKKYADSERQLRQLKRASGDYSDALEEQAKALSKLYAVDDDLIMQSETLLSQWGGAAAASKEAEVAALNLASAMGTDLATATELLIRNVESGGTGLAKMGIHFKATGDKGKDLAAAVAAINSKLGGAAGADAASLTGQLHAADLAFEDIQKTIGGSVAKFMEQTGAAGALTEALRNLNEFLGNEGANKLLKDGERMSAWVGAQRDLAEAELALREAKADPNVGLTVLEAFLDDVTRAQAKVDALKASAAPLLGNAPGVTGATNKGMKDEAKPGDLFGDVGAGWKKSFQETTEEQVDAMAARSVEIQAAEEKAGGEYEALMREQAKEQAEARQKSLDAEEKMVSDSLRAQHALRDQASQESTQALQKQASDASAAANAIGAAFVNALTDQLAKLAQGGELDVAVFVGDIIAAAIGVASVALSAAFPQFAGLIQAVGGLSTVGVRAGAAGISADNKRRRASSEASRTSYSYHDGGWVGAPRHHSGAWIGPDEQRAILQTGERVLSRAEVHHMGGPAGVDGAAKGRGGVTNIFQVHALDAKSAAESFESEVGRGLKRAQESGRGDVPALLGSPR